MCYLDWRFGMNLFCWIFGEFSFRSPWWAFTQFLHFEQIGFIQFLVSPSSRFAGSCLTLLYRQLLSSQSQLPKKTNLQFRLVANRNFRLIGKGFNHYIGHHIKFILDCSYNRRSSRSSLIPILGWANAKFKMGSFSLATWFYGTLFCFGSLIMASAQTRR